VVALTDASGLAARSIKYAAGILSGKWVVSFDWIIASFTNRKWMEEAPFEVKGDSHSMGAPERARASGKKLFSGHSFYLYGEFSMPTKEEIEMLIKLGGGEVLSEMPAKIRNTQEWLSFTEVILCDPLKCTTDDARKVCLMTMRYLVPIQWLMDCISSYEITDPRDSYIIPEKESQLQTQNSITF